MKTCLLTYEFFLEVSKHSQVSQRHIISEIPLATVMEACTDFADTDIL